MEDVYGFMVDTADVVEIHDRIIRETGGNSGIVNYGNIDFAVNQANESKDVYLKAARMLWILITNHGFVDGNKRTAAVATETLLEENGFVLTADEEEIWRTVRGISDNRLKLPEVLSWIKRNVKKE